MLGAPQYVSPLRVPFFRVEVEKLEAAKAAVVLTDRMVMTMVRAMINLIDFFIEILPFLLFG